MSKIDEVKTRLDIVDVISDYVELRKSGRNYSAFCPFHADTRSPSFVVFPETQGWHCFGACGEGGDVFSFIMKQENLSFGEALRLLARRAGVELEPATPEQTRAAAERERLQGIMAAAASYYHHQLLRSPAGEEARAYLLQRELSAETANRFQLGYAPDQWESLKAYLLQQRHSVADMVAAGLEVERESASGHYDRFRHRLMIPIRLPTTGRDRRGHVVAFGGRVLRSDDMPKYLNSPQTSLFDKSAILFGLDMARESIRRRDQAVIAEGYMDVLQAHQNGFRNVVASMGTALTEDQLRSLTRLTSNLVLALDADTAGAQATLRGLDMARSVLDKDVTPVVTPQGLVRYEGRLQIALRITILPPGKDPDDVIRDDPDHWRQLIDGALPVLDYYFRALTGNQDLDDPKGKAEAVRRLAPILNEVSNEVERAHYLQQLSRMVRVDERALSQQISAAVRTIRSRRSSALEEPPPTVGVSRSDYQLGSQEYCLACLVRYPSLLEQLNNSFAEIGTSPLAPDDLGRVENQQLFQVLSRLEGSEKLRDALDPVLHEYLDWLLEAAGSYIDLPSDKIETEILVTALRLRQDSLRRRLTQLRFVQEDAQSEERRNAVTETAEDVGRLREELREVQRAFGRRFSLGRQRLTHERW
jgi:DNA primase